MAKFDIEIVGKIGSMALIQKQEGELDYNVFARIGRELRPGMLWVSSGATEIGRLDHMRRNDGRQLLGDTDDVKADYSAQGQAILMENYRRFISDAYSVRQLLVEHTHFNDAEKREHIRRFLMRCPAQGAIPIINYNDPVSSEEIRHVELMDLEAQGGEHIVECIDNDETAAVIATLMHARYLIIFTSADGIYEDPNDPSTLIEHIAGATTDEVVQAIREYQKNCHGASRQGAGGARAKLEFCINPVLQGTIVKIASPRYTISEIIQNRAPHTTIGVAD